MVIMGGRERERMCWLPPLWLTEAVRTEERRQEFITEKYIELKYTGEEERETIREQRKETRAESVRRSNKLISHTSMWTLQLLYMPALSM